MTQATVTSNTRHQRGFTLIEILVVMVIIGVVAGMAAIVVSGNKEKRELENEARKILAILQLTQEEAVYQNVEIGVRIDEKGYQFKALDEENLQWVDLSQDYLRTREFPEWIELEFDGIAKEFELRRKENPGKPTFLPQVLFLSSGENTPFSLTLKLKNVPDFEYTLESDGLNGIAISEPSDEE